MQAHLKAQSNRIHQSVRDLKDAKFAEENKCMSPDPAQTYTKTMMSSTAKKAVNREYSPKSVNGPGAFKKGKRHQQLI